MFRNLNSTCISLIPKSNKPKNCSELRPISLCNVAYKFFTKIIANRLILKLVDMMSKE